MRLLILLITLLCYCFHSSAQQIQFERIAIGSVESVKSIHKARKFRYDHTIGVSEDYFPNRMHYRLAQPIVYRNDIQGGKLETSFYYSLPDSAIRLIEYWWEGESKNSNYGRKLVKRIRKKIARHLDIKGIHYPETGDKAEKIIWENTILHVQQFWVLGENNRYFMRVLISWKDGGS